MEDNFEETLTARSLLKGILATEPIRPAVSHQSKQSTLGFERVSTSRIYQDRNSPSMDLRGKMKARVRHTLGKSALEVSTLKRNVEIIPKIEQKSGKRGSHLILEALAKITPRTLLKKIIQNEDEVSVIVSQRSKTVIDDKKPETIPTARLSSLGNVNLSLPDFQDTEHVAVFRNFRKKRRMNSSEFEREVDERLPKNKDNYSILNDKYEDSSLLVNPYTMSRSVENKLDILAAPESTYKSGLLRRPNKICLVSLGDFEQGVEDKYQVLKGSQECFIESTAEYKSDASSDDVAQMSTKLYAQPFLQEINAPNSDEKHRRISKSFDSIYNERREPEDDFLEASINGVSVNVQPKLTDQSMGKSEAVIKDTRDIGSDSGKDNGIGTDLMANVEYGQNHFSVTESGKLTGMDTFSPKMQNSRLNEENCQPTAQSINVHASSVSRKEDNYDSSQDGTSENLLLAQSIIHSDQSMGKSEAVIKDTRDIGSDSGEDNGIGTDLMANVEYAQKHFSVTESGKLTGMDTFSPKMKNSRLNEENCLPTAQSINVHASSVSRKEDNYDSSQDGTSENLLLAQSIIHSDQSMGKSEAVIKDTRDIGSDSGEDNGIGTDLMANVEYAQKHFSVTESGKLTGMDTFSPKMKNSRLNEENCLPTAQSINVHASSVSRKEDNYDSSQDGTSENLLLAQSIIHSEISTFGNKKKNYKQPMLSGLIDTPGYIKKARFTVDNKATVGNKPTVGKKIQQKKNMPTKKKRSVFTGSLVKQTFGLHAHMRVSKEASTDVEKCLEVYLDRLSLDLAAYTAHANRKTITRADMELLMKRQHLVTDTTSLNVLIERHLSLECRKLLIPCAMSKNKVFPKI